MSVASVAVIPTLKSSDMPYRLPILQDGLVGHTKLGKHRIHETTGTHWRIASEGELAADGVKDTRQHGV